MSLSIINSNYWKKISLFPNCFNFSKILIKPLFRGHFGLSNGISPPRIGCFLFEIWQKEGASGTGNFLFREKLDQIFGSIIPSSFYSSFCAIYTIWRWINGPKVRLEEGRVRN
jgi:hypothetical protein